MMASTADKVEIKGTLANQPIYLLVSQIKVEIE